MLWQRHNDSKLNLKHWKCFSQLKSLPIFWIVKSVLVQLATYIQLHSNANLNFSIWSVLNWIIWSKIWQTMNSVDFTIDFFFSVDFSTCSVRVGLLEYSSIFLFFVYFCGQKLHHLTFSLHSKKFWQNYIWKWVYILCLKICVILLLKICNLPVFCCNATFLVQIEVILHHKSGNIKPAQFTFFCCHKRND